MWEALDSCGSLDKILVYGEVAREKLGLRDEGCAFEFFYFFFRFSLLSHILVIFLIIAMNTYFGYFME